MLQTVTRREIFRTFNGNASAQITDILDLVDGPGDTFFVDSGSGADTKSGTEWNDPLATLDAAVGKCSANNGDVIYIKPGHSETLSADSAVDIDVAGVTVIGLGYGAARPTFTFDTAVTADFKLAAASVVIKNLLFIAGIDALTGPIAVSGADCAVIDCEYRDDDSNNYETTDVLIIVTGGTRCLVDGFKFVHDGGSGGTQIQSVVNVATDVVGVEVRNCYIVCDGALGCIEYANAADANVHHNYCESSHANDVCITLGATTTGLVYSNFLKLATDGQATWITATNDCGLFENYGVNADSQAGGLIGTVST